MFRCATEDVKAAKATWNRRPPPAALRDLAT